MTVPLYMAAGERCSKWDLSGQICACPDIHGKFVTEEWNGG